MAYWLMKSEPGNWSWDDQVKDGVAEWDGVRNYQAANNMKAMRIGDKVFFYHSVKEKQVVKALRPFTRPVSLAEIKAEPRLEELALIRQSRLSVMPVRDQEWRLICAMGETKP
jgi:predicted RNA-binding protein with PUA-like domain